MINHAWNKQIKEKVNWGISYLRHSETSFLLIFSVTVGICTGFGAILFRWLLNTFRILFFDKGGQLLHFMGPYHVIIIPAAGGLIVGPLVYFFAREAKGHGVPEVMLAVASAGGRIRPRVALVKILASSICIGSGGSVGREGPIVQIGSTLGSTLGQLFKLTEEKIKSLVACGAAGGIAATFNAPLAGIFFSLEVILGQYGLKYFSSVVLSSVTATVISRTFLGNHPAFMVPQYALLSAWEIPLYFIFGFIAAFVALLYIKAIYKSEDVFDAWNIPEYIKPAIGGIGIGLIGLYFPQIFGVGYETIEQALYGKVTLVLVTALVFIKIMATSVTLGSGGSGGVFAPALFIGAMLGESYAKLTQLIVPSIAIPSGAGALVGMGAVFAGASHAPISAILIMFEMTGNYLIILPLMITCITSTVVVRRFSKESIYTLKLARRGINLEELRSADFMSSITVSEAMVSDVVTFNDEIPVQDAEINIRSDPSFRHRGFPVLSQEKHLVGMVTRKDISEALTAGKKSIPIREIMTRDIAICYPGDTLKTALQKLGEKDVGRIPVVERENPLYLIGLVTRENIIAAYNKALKKEQKAD
ncbi:MAG: chloride channel protein [Nitrospirota bacterium]